MLAFANSVKLMWLQSQMHWSVIRSTLALSHAYQMSHCRPAVKISGFHPARRPGFVSRPWDLIVRMDYYQGKTKQIDGNQKIYNGVILLTGYQRRTQQIGILFAQADKPNQKTSHKMISLYIIFFSSPFMNL